MLKLKSEIWTNSKGKRFVMLSEDDFARLAELAEDAGLSCILKRAKAADTNQPNIPFAQVKRQLAISRRRKSNSNN